MSQPAEVRALSEFVTDADVMVALGERRAASDELVKAQPGNFAAASPLPDDACMIAVTSFKTPEDRIVRLGERVRADDPIAVRSPELFIEEHLTTEERRSELRARAYNAPAARVRREDEREAAARRDAARRQEQLARAAELEAEAHALRAAAA